MFVRIWIYLPKLIFKIAFCRWMLWLLYIQLPCHQIKSLHTSKNILAANNVPWLKYLCSCCNLTKRIRKMIFQIKKVIWYAYFYMKKFYITLHSMQNIPLRIHIILESIFKYNYRIQTSSKKCPWFNKIQYNLIYLQKDKLCNH